ncbi:MAG: tryptophan synthase subunit alpha [Jiangellales bacterium]
MTTALSTGEQALADVFATASQQQRAALIGYLPAGYPSVDGAADAMLAMVDAGADLVEVGLPYSDPLMDGPVIQQAVDAALRAGTTTTDVLRTVETLAGRGVTAVVMSYWNPIERHGAAAFARDLAAAGGAGVITPDLIPDEAADWLVAARAAALGTVFLVAPSSTDDRLALTARACRGFVYAASTMGVTGARASVGGAAERLVGRTREVTDLPIGVGLGVSTGEQAAEVAGFADGVIVGSALVRELLAADTPAAGLDALGVLTADLAAGVQRT